MFGINFKSPLTWLVIGGIYYWYTNQQGQALLPAPEQASTAPTQASTTAAAGLGRFGAW